LFKFCRVVVKFSISIGTALSYIAHNEPAAWRSGGVSISGYAVQRDDFYFLKVSAETSNHFAKPLVSSSVDFCVHLFMLSVCKDTNNFSISDFVRNSAERVSAKSNGMA
jgi:hypothetical protein